MSEASEGRDGAGADSRAERFPTPGRGDRLRARACAALPDELALRLQVAARHGVPEFLRLPRAELDRKLVERLFRHWLGREPDLEDPTTFNEKIQWRKLHDRRPLWPLLLDKIRVRDWVRDRVGGSYLIPLLHVTRDPADLTVDRLRPPSIVKPNHMSGFVFPVRDASDARRLSAGPVGGYLRHRLQFPFGQHLGEWGYRDIEPRLLVERLLLDGDGTTAQDYEMHCFGGEPQFIHLDRNMRTSAPATTSIYDTEWRLTEMKWEDRPRGPDVPPPPRLEEMLEVAGALAEGTDYLRVDLYDRGGEVFFGEMTVYPASGLQAMAPPGADEEWGRRWRLPEPTASRVSRPARGE